MLKNQCIQQVNYVDKNLLYVILKRVLNNFKLVWYMVVEEIGEGQVRLAGEVLMPEEVFFW